MTHNYRTANSQNDGIVLAHTMYGTPVTGTQLQNSVGGPEIQSAVGWSTAPYISPEEWHSKRIHTARRCQGNEGTCKGFPMKEIDYCPGHARGLGLVPNWSKKGRAQDGDAPAAS